MKENETVMSLEFKPFCEFNGELREPNKCHDWANHIPESIEAIWDKLSHSERKLVAMVAEDAADRERWD